MGENEKGKNDTIGGRETRSELLIDDQMDERSSKCSPDPIGRPME